MADYGIKVSKAGTDVKTAPTSSTKKNYTILSTDTVPKVSAQAIVSTNTNVAHGLGFIPMWDAYIVENSSTEAHPISGSTRVEADSTYLYITADSSNKIFYIIYLDQP